MTNIITITPICNGCNRTPADIDEYVSAAQVYGDEIDDVITPEEYVRLEEGTYNPDNGHFLCTSCYVAAGMPSGPYGWMAP